jgi:WD40 repeat protein
VIWDLNNDQELIRLSGNGYSIISLKFSSDDSQLASSSSDGLITLWDVTAGTQQQVIEDSNNRLLAFSSDGKMLASADERVHIWDIKTENRLLDFASALSEIISDVDFTRINNLAFSSDDTFLIFSTGGHHIEQVEIPTGEAKLLLAKTTCLRSVTIDGNSRHLSSSSSDGLIELWKFPSGGYLTSFLDPNALYGMSLKYFSLINEMVEEILYTLPCDYTSELPDDAICVCNCVDGLSTKELPRCSSGGGGGGGGGGSICTCNLVCTCNVVYI